MSNIKLNCCGCGKELGLGNRVSSDGVLWRCEDCARKQREEYDNKDRKIADLEAKLTKREKEKEYYQDLYFTSVKGQEKLKQQLADSEGKILELQEDSIKNELLNLIALRTNETFFIDGKKFRDYINNEIELTKKENKNE